MKVEIVDINSITPYERNPSVFTQASVDSLVTLITRFGFRQPIHVDSKNVIIAGHRRRLAAIKLNLKKVPIIRHEDMSEEECTAWRIADNRAAEDHQWDNALLADQLSELGDIFSPDQLGFETSEIAKIFDLDKGINEADPDNPDAPIDMKRFTSRPGDTWTLGKNTLHVGDDPEAADTLIKHWQKKAKKKALLGDQPFDAVNAERSVEVS